MKIRYNARWHGMGQGHPAMKVYKRDGHGMDAEEITNLLHAKLIPCLPHLTLGIATLGIINLNVVSSTFSYPYK